MRKILYHMFVSWWWNPNAPRPSLPVQIFDVIACLLVAYGVIGWIIGLIIDGRIWWVITGLLLLLANAVARVYGIPIRFKFW